MMMPSSPIKTEITAGITSFLTMAYIAFVNPSILHDAGMNEGAVFTATCLVTAFACFMTAFFAKAPIGIAPGMALNIYFTYSVVQGLDIDWQHALAMVFISGVLFFIISLTPIRRILIEAIPHNLQIAILIGISLLIALIALQTNHLIVRGEHTMMHIGNLSSSESILFWLGFIIILTLDYYQIPAAIIIGILSMSSLGLLLGLSPWHGLIALPPSIKPTLLQLDFSHLNSGLAYKAIFTFFLIAVFDATGTLIGLFNHPKLQNASQNKRITSTLQVDAIASSMAALLGTASTSPFIESAAGIQAGGRTGQTAFVIGCGFVLMLFFFPLASSIPNYAVGPALLYVACCMMKHLSGLKLDDITEAAPCMLTIIMIPFTTSIADGIGTGIVLYTALKYLCYRETNFFLVLLSLLFLVFFVIS